MKKITLILLLSSFLNSCAFNSYPEAYNFDNFRDTPLWELAKAVRDNDSIKVKEIANDKKLDLNFKDPKFNQTLLALSIINEKNGAFIELLNAGADSNVLLGDLDTTAFLYAIDNQKNCNVFYVENLLKHGANPNLEIINPTKESFFFNSFPLLVAIGKGDSNGNGCINTVKLLVDNGADINCCYQNPRTDLCEGVITRCLKSRKMEVLKYFVIEKKITIPDTVYIRGSINKETQKVYSLSEILNTDDFQFKNKDLVRFRNARNDILIYLKSIEKK